MILSFMENFPSRMKLNVANGERVPTQFVSAIETGYKIHTIRDTKQKWRKDVKIQVYTGKYAKGCRKHHFDLECTGTQTIEIDFTDKWNNSIKIDGRKLTNKEVDLLAQSDGFGNTTIPAWVLFQMWFGNKKPFKGIIIHWTDFRY